MKFLLSSIIVLTLLATSLPVIGQDGSKFEPSKDAWKNADKLLKGMSVEEKVGQLIHVGVNAKFANQESAYFKELKRQVTENKIGGIIFFGAPIYETTI